MWDTVGDEKDDADCLIMAVDRTGVKEDMKFLICLICVEQIKTILFSLY